VHQTAGADVNRPFQIATADVTGAEAVVRDKREGRLSHFSFTPPNKRRNPLRGTARFVGGGKGLEVQIGGCAALIR